MLLVKEEKYKKKINLNTYASFLLGKDIDYLFISEKLKIKPNSIMSFKDMSHIEYEEKKEKFDLLEKNRIDITAEYYVLIIKKRAQSQTIISLNT